MNKYKKFHFKDGIPPIHFRPGTHDEELIHNVMVERKGYLLPALEPKLVYDIGANIGVMTLVLANIYSDAEIHAFEPNEENFELLQMNTAHLGDRVKLNKFALSNINSKAILHGSTDLKNRGGFSLKADLKPGEERLPSSEVLLVRVRDYMRTLGCPEVIKIDCEGSEFDILSDFEDLDKITWITGELHHVRSFELLELLSKTHEIQTARAFGAPVFDFLAGNRAKLFTKVQPKQKDRALAAIGLN